MDLYQKMYSNLHIDRYHWGLDILLSLFSSLVRWKFLVEVLMVKWDANVKRSRGNIRS